MKAQTSTRTRCMKLTTPSSFIQPKSEEVVQIGAYPLHDFAEYGQAIKMVRGRFTLLALHLSLHLNESMRNTGTAFKISKSRHMHSKTTFEREQIVRLMFFRLSMRSTAKYAGLFG